MIPSILKTQADRFPHKPVLIEETRSLTFRQWIHYAENLAKNLQKEGFQGERIAFHVSNSLEFAVSCLGCLMAGAVIVPIQTTLKFPEIAYILEHTQPRLLVTDSRENFGSIEKCSPADFSNHFERITPAVLAEPHPQDPAAIFFTSGSTAKPKGVTHSQASLKAVIESMSAASDLTEQDRYLITETMTNVSGYSHIFLAPSKGGASLIISGFTISSFIQASALKPTVISVMGSGNSLIVNSPQLGPEHFSGIRFNFTGGDQISPAFMRAFQEKTGFPMLYGYGMSEFLLLTVNKSADPSKLGSIGKEALHAEIKILDPKKGKRVKKGEVGEIWVRGPNCMLGYWNEDELTRNTIMDGWLRTGDLARQDEEGDYWFIGRIKMLIIRGGDNISPLEVEEVLSRHPAVNAVGVTGIPDPVEGAVPYAFVELKPEQSVTEEELTALASGELEDYKVPVRIFFLEKLPRTPSGKIARKKLSPPK